MRDSKDNNEVKKDMDDTKERLVKIEEQLGDMFEYIKKMNILRKWINKIFFNRNRYIIIQSTSYGLLLLPPVFLKPSDYDH